MGWQFVCVLLSVLFIFYLAYTVFKYTRMISHIFLSLKYRPSIEAVVVSRGAPIEILDSSDHHIQAIFLEKERSKKLAIFCHESGAGRESWEKYAYFLPDIGFSILSVDLDAASDAEGVNTLSQWPTHNQMERLSTAIRWAKRAISSDVAIVLFGVSNGADVALAASFYDTAVKAVITDGLFSMKEVFRDYIRKWAPILVKPNFFGDRHPKWVIGIFASLGFWYSEKRSGKRFVDVEYFLRVKHKPLFMIYGQQDDYVPESHREFLSKMNQKKNVSFSLVVPNAKHNESVLVAREDYQRDVETFLETCVI